MVERQVVTLKVIGSNPIYPANLVPIAQLEAGKTLKMSKGVSSNLTRDTIDPLAA